jgi:hypothetical protein
LDLDCGVGSTVIVSNDGAPAVFTINGQSVTLAGGNVFALPCSGTVEIIGQAGNITASSILSPMSGFNEFFSPLMVGFLIGSVIGISFVRGLT